MQHQSKVQL